MDCRDTQRLITKANKWLLGRLYRKREKVLLATLCGQHIALARLYRDSQKERRQREDELVKLMLCFNTTYVIRKNNLLLLRYIHRDYWRIETFSLSHHYADSLDNIGLIPLADPYLEAITTEQKNYSEKSRTALLIAKAAQNEHQTDSDKGSFVYGQRRFEWEIGYGGGCATVQIKDL